MSINKFKVGNKVKVRSDLIAETVYDGVYVNKRMIKYCDKILTIEGVKKDCYVVEDNDWDWNDEMLEPAGKTLYNLEKGDIVLFEKNGEKCKVLAVIDNCCLLSYPDNFTSANSWYTVDDLKYYECTVQQLEIETVEINGKEYDKNEVEKAIKDLEPIE
jgi:hypothetical protein